MAAPDTGIDWNAISAVATAAATILALALVLREALTRNADQKLRRSLWGPSLRLQTSSAWRGVDGCRLIASGYSTIDPSPMQIRLLDEELRGITRWPSHNEVLQIAATFPRSAAELAAASAEISIAFQQLAGAALHNQPSDRNAVIRRECMKLTTEHLSRAVSHMNAAHQLLE